MGQTSCNGRYEKMIFQARRAKDEMMRLTSHDKQNSDVDNIRQVLHIMYADNILRHLNSKTIACRGITMQVARDNGNITQCNYCKGVGHIIQDYTILKVRKYRYD